MGKPRMGGGASVKAAASNRPRFHSHESRPKRAKSEHTIRMGPLCFKKQTHMNPWHKPWVGNHSWLDSQKLRVTIGAYLNRRMKRLGKGGGKRVSLQPPNIMVSQPKNHTFQLAPNKPPPLGREREPLLFGLHDVRWEHQNKKGFGCGSNVAISKQRTLWKGKTETCGLLETQPLNQLKRFNNKYGWFGSSHLDSQVAGLVQSPLLVFLDGKKCVEKSEHAYQICLISPIIALLCLKKLN